MEHTAADELGPVLEELGRAECLDLLRRAAFGRLVMSERCIPVAFPVNVSVVDGDVIFTTDDGPKLDAARRGDVLTIEADEIDRTYHTGWSVLVTGVAQVVTETAAVVRARQELTPTWVPGHSAHVVRIPATHVTGRRLNWVSPAAVPIAR
jgi:nitroimidazol reductase NimA-like FMN-containing flavoprotein (pyridoxamine 5'-phosphate oxidase superfamily)